MGAFPILQNDLDKTLNRIDTIGYIENENRETIKKLFIDCYKTIGGTGEKKIYATFIQKEGKDIGYQICSGNKGEIQDLGIFLRSDHRGNSTGRLLTSDQIKIAIDLNANEFSGTVSTPEGKQFMKKLIDEGFKVEEERGNRFSMSKINYEENLKILLSNQ